MDNTVYSVYLAEINFYAWLINRNVHTLCQMLKKKIYLQSMKENKVFVCIAMIEIYCDNENVL